MDSDQIKAVWMAGDTSQGYIIRRLEDIWMDEYIKEIRGRRADFFTQYMDKLEDCPVVRKEAEAYLIRAKHLEKHPKNSWENHQRRLIKQKLKESKLKLTLLNAPVPEGQELENILSSM